MDPLSVAASIVGILAAATKVVEILTPVVSSLTESTKNASILCARIESSRNVLSALQKLFNNSNATPRKRKELIPIDHLIISLTNGVLLFSELEEMVLQLGTSTENLRTRIQWARKDKTLNVMITRLQSFEISISVMLSILQCESDLEAAMSQKELYESNMEISQRLANLENALQLKNESDANIKPTANRRSSIISGTLITQFEFEGDLESSRAYRKAQRPSADFSFRSSVVPSHAWSALSDVSLSDISILAVVALPISSDDITNGHHYQVQETHLEALEEKLEAGHEASLTKPRPPYRFANPSGVSATHGRPALPLLPPPLLGRRPMLLIPPTLHSTNSRANNSYKDNTALVKIEEPPVDVPPRRTHLKWMQEYNLVILGYGGVGKTALTMQTMRDLYVDEYDPTIEEKYRRSFHIDDEWALLDVLDTGGQEQFSAMKEQYIRTGRGFMLVYSIASRASFEELLSLQQTILRVKDKDYFPMIMIGNKCDLLAEREVTTEEGQALASQLGCPFREVSSKRWLDVNNAFFDLVREIRRYEREIRIPKMPSEQEATNIVPARTAKLRKRWLKRTKPDNPPLESVDEG